MCGISPTWSFVPVLISSFDACVFTNSVKLTWKIIEDGEIKGSKIYRKDVQSNVVQLLSDTGFVSPRERKYIDSNVLAGRTYEYTLTVVLSDDSEMKSQTVSVKIKPYLATLHQNYPNPFNPITTISFTLPIKTQANLSIYDLEGRLVKTLVNDTLGEGFKEVTWGGSDTQGKPFSSSVYFYCLKARGKVLIREMVLLK